MSTKEKVIFTGLITIRSLVSILDLMGILAIGYITSTIALSFSATSQSSNLVQFGAFQIPPLTLESLPFAIFLVLALFSSKALISILLTYTLAQFLARIEARAAREIARVAFGRGIQDSRVSSREEIQFAVQIGSPSAFNSLLNSLGTLIAEGFLFVIILAAFAIVDTWVALGAVLFFGAIGFLMQVFIGNILNKTGIKLGQKTVEANSGLSDLVDVVKEATVTGRREFFYNKIFNSRLDASRLSATQFVLSGMPRYIVETALIFAISIFILSQILSNNVSASAATLGVFISGGFRLTASLLPLQTALLTIKQATPFANRAFEFLKYSSELKNGEVHKNTERSSNEPVLVKIRDLSFSYSGSSNRVLDRVSIDIKPGSQVAFIGPSGAGKTTLADVLLGVLQPNQGSVLLNGSLPETVIQLTPGLLGYVPQKPGMIAGTIAQNIALGLDESQIDEHKLLLAIEKAHLKEFISSLPDGASTSLGKQKDELSGGQLQRIGLARALYTEPGLLVMDEATSALDADSESQINTALDAMRGQVTVILIAHRLNTIQRSDTVYLMEEGRIADSGTFEQLFQSNPKVQSLVELMKISSEN